MHSKTFAKYAPINWKTRRVRSQRLKDYTKPSAHLRLLIDFQSFIERVYISNYYDIMMMCDLYI